MVSHPHLEIHDVFVLKADRLCASILRQTALQAFPSASVRTATSLASASAALRDTPTDLLLTGVTMLDGDALELLSEPVRTRNFRRALVVTGRREHRVLTILRGLPINGTFDPMSEDLEQLEAAIRTAGAGGQYWSPTVLTRLGNRTASSGSLCHLLSPTEQLVFAVIGDGSDDSTAADRLNLKASTVHSVRRELHRKLGVQHKGELVRMAVQHGYVRFTVDGVERPGFSSLLAACGKSIGFLDSSEPFERFKGISPSR